MAVSQQIKLLIDTLQVSKSEFARQLGTSPTTVSNIYTGTHNPKSELLSSLLEAYPQVSANWLLTGEGSMWKEGVYAEGAEPGQVMMEPQADYGLKDEAGLTLLDYKRQLKEARKRISVLEDLVESQKEVIKMWKERG